VNWVRLEGPDAAATFVGRPCPGNPMPRESAVTKHSRARSVTSGLRKLLAPGDQVRIEGVDYARDAIIDAFERHEKALELKRLRWAAYRQTVAEERDLARTSNWFWVRLKRWANTTRTGADVLALGMTKYRKTGPKTLRGKVAGVQKRAKKRRAK
jgi:hypothetical protein